MLTRTWAHVAFAAIVWPLLTVVGTTIALTDLPYHAMAFGEAFAASIVGTILSAPDMIVAGTVFFGLTGLIFQRLGRDTRRENVRTVSLALEPLLSFVAAIAGISVWYPAVLSQPLLAPVGDIRTMWVALLLGGSVALGAAFVARPGRRVRLAMALIAFAVLSPAALVARAALDRFTGHTSEVVILGVDSVSYDAVDPRFAEWVRSRGGTLYEHAVAPGLLTNAVWTSVLTMKPVRAHGVFHTFQGFPSGVPSLISAARDKGYRTVSVFPDQLTCAAGSRAGFDEDRSGPVGWRQLLLPLVLNNSFLVPVLKPALPRLWPSFGPSNHAGTFTYDLRREVRGILKAGSRRQATLVAAHLTYTHAPAYPGSSDLSWAELWKIARAPAGTIRDRSFDWQDVDKPTDPLRLHRWKLQHVHRVIEREVDATRFLEKGGRLIVFSDHGDRAGLTVDTFTGAQYHHVPLMTFGLPARCAAEPISLIDIGSLLGLSNMRALPQVEFTIGSQALWSSLVSTARLRWSGDVDLDEHLLGDLFNQLRRHHPWRELESHRCDPAHQARAHHGSSTPGRDRH